MFSSSEGREGYMYSDSKNYSNVWWFCSAYKMVYVGVGVPLSIGKGV